MTEEVERIERDKGAALQFEDVRTLVEGKRGREAEARGDPDGGVWSAGQSVGLIGDIPSCASLVRSMVAEAERVIRSELQALLVAPAPRSRRSTRSGGFCAATPMMFSRRARFGAVRTTWTQ